MPLLERATFNLGNLSSTSDRPTETQFEHFRLLFNHLKTQKIKPQLQLFLNHVRIDEALPAVQFDDLKLNEPLVFCHLHNYHQNRSLLQQSLLHTAFYLDVLATFGQLRLSSSTSEKIYGFVQFARQFPQIRVVTLDNRPLDQRAKIDSSLFLKFLSELRGLQKLEIFHAEFQNDFYQCMHRLDCLRTLTTLVIVERFNKFHMRIDFGFLNTIIYLESFCTNLVSSVVMPDLIAKMRVGAQYMFAYENKEIDPNFNQVAISKLDFWRFEIILDLRIKKKASKPLKRQYFEFDDLSRTNEFLLSQNLHHWLDDMDKTSLLLQSWHKMPEQS